MQNQFLLPSHLIHRPIKIVVIGAGGTGSILLGLLAQMDHTLRKLTNDEVYLSVHVCDGDTVSEFNLGRQSFYPMDLGHYKSEVLVQRFIQFCGCEWTYSTENIDPNSFHTIGIDMVITCVDSAKFRYQLGHTTHAQTDEDTLWLDCGNDASSGQVVLGHLCGSRDEKLPNIYDLYGDLLNGIVDRLEDSCSHEQAINAQEFGINHTLAINASNLLWQLLRKGKLDCHGMFIDNSKFEVLPLKIDPMVWSTFGYSAKQLTNDDN